jgi:hypothetical protein
MHKIISSVPFFYTDSSIFIYFSCCIRQQMRYHRNTISQRVKKRPEPLLSQGFRRPCQGVDATGFEPATSASRTQRSTKLSHASMCFVFASFASNSFSISHLFTFVNNKFQNFLILKILKVNSTVRLCGGINSCISRV